MQRHLLGLIAILFLATGVGLWVTSKSDIAWVALRIGMVLAAMWLALPQVIAMFSKIPRWLIYVAAAAVLVAAFPKAFLIVIPVVAGFAVLHFVKWMFKPLPPRKNPPSPRRGERGRG